MYSEGTDDSRGERAMVGELNSNASPIPTCRELVYNPTISLLSLT